MRILAFWREENHVHSHTVFANEAFGGGEPPFSTAIHPNQALVFLAQKQRVPFFPISTSLLFAFSTSCIR
jgi:hypothetical protein